MSSALTKSALAASFCRLLAERPFCKITVADIAGGCGLSRMTFYYHFQDVYDLLTWTCGERASAACEGLEWQEGLLRLFRTVRRDRDLVMNVYRSVDRSVLEAALFPFAHDLILREMGARRCGCHGPGRPRVRGRVLRVRLCRHPAYLDW